jgi:hypothetical protein
MSSCMMLGHHCHLSFHICARVMAEQHIHLAHRRPGFIGIICTDLSLPDAIAFAAQRTRQARRWPLCHCAPRACPLYTAGHALPCE